MITRDEVIELCDKLGLVEYQAIELNDFRIWKFPNKIFSTQHDATIIVLSKDPYHELCGGRLYFYNKLKYNKTYGYSMTCENIHNAYCTKDGEEYSKLYDKKTFEKAIINVIKKIKKTEANLKLKNIMKDFK